MLVEARGKVVALLNERLADLHLLSRALLEHETLTASDIKRVLAGERLAPPAASVALRGAAAAGQAGEQQPAGAEAGEGAEGEGVALDEQ